MITRSCTNLTFGRTRKFIPPPWLDGIPSRVFDMLHCLETILPSVESFRFSVQDEAYFMGGGAALEVRTAHFCFLNFSF